MQRISRKAVISAAAFLSLAVVGMAQPALTVKSVAAAGQHSLALASDGTVWEWGQDWLPLWGGQAPTRVGGLSGIVAIGSAPMHNLAVKTDGSVWAWGGGWAGGELAAF